MKVFRVEFIIFGLLAIAAGILLLKNKYAPEKPAQDFEVIVLGIAQDAGYPQVQCKKSCCKNLWSDKSKRKMVSCIGIRDNVHNQAWMIDATPDFKDQLEILLKDRYEFKGVFLTHAHMGHYTGLMQLGKEAMGSEAVPVYAMPRMKEFLATNGPWDQLVSQDNIRLEDMNDHEKILLNNGLSITPFLVPHRDEYSETVGYKVNGNKELIFIPDIDKWEKWNKDINQYIQSTDYALLDGCFYRNGEIWGRDMSQIPHPFIEESTKRFSALSKENQEKIHFIHLNHTNPLLNPYSKESKEFEQTHYSVAKEYGIYEI